MSAKRDSQSFEELYRRLEEAVEKLERGGLSLEESITLYEQGMELAKRCQEVLDKAELRITKLRESFAQPSPQPAAVEDGAFDDELPDDD